MGRSRKVKSSVSIHISRPESAVIPAKKLAIRAVSIYRRLDGRLTSSTSHIMARDRHPQSDLNSANPTPVTPAQSVDCQSSMQAEDVEIDDYNNNFHDGGQPASQRVRCVRA
jgi:hypothetical protein